MPRKKATAAESAASKPAAQRAKASSQKAKAAAASSGAPMPTAPTGSVARASGVTPSAPQESVAAALVQGAQALQNTHSQPGSENLPDLNTHTPTDYTQASGDGPEMTKSEADAAIEQIERRINAQKVIQKNMDLAQNVETSRQGLAKYLQSMVKAGVAMESISGEVAKHESQVEGTRLEREKALQKALEADGLEGMRDLVTQEAQQKHALKSARIARLEQQTARLLNDDAGVVDAPEAVPVEY